MASTRTLLVALSVASLATTPTALAATVESFSPQGTVKGVRQVTARFSAQMVPFGDPRLAEPFDIACPEKGTGRWVDSKSWAYDFDQDLPGGIKCIFELKPSVRTLKGEAVTGEREFAFSTGGPAIIQSEPREGGTIEEDQIFILGLDAAATEESILKHVSCDIEGITEWVGVRLLKGEERKVLLEQSRYFLQEYFYALFKEGEDLWALKVPAKGTKREKFLKSIEAEQSSVVVLQCRRRLPNNKSVRLVWGEGVSSLTGIAGEQTQALAFQTREAFLAKFSCERVNAKSDCIPILPLTLSFTAPISTVEAKKVRLRASDGKVYEPEIKAQEGEPQDWISAIRFPAPLPELSKFTLELPIDLKDDAGRALTNQNRFPLAVKTDEFPPLAKFAARFGIIEARDPVLPITLRNLESKLPTQVLQLSNAPNEGAGPKSIPGQILKVPSNLSDLLFWLKRLNYYENDQWDYDRVRQQNVRKYRVGTRSMFKPNAPTRKIDIPKPGGGKEFEVVGIALKEPGLYLVEVASPKLGARLLARKQPYYAQSAALVTDLAAHFKWGVESSLVWVTTLDQAKPQPNAEVMVSDCQGTVMWQGKTDKHGIALINQHLPLEHELPHCDQFGNPLIVFARSGGDMTFVRSDWNEGISSWRFNLNTDFTFQPSADTTVFARTLLRAGETVHMKHFHRKRLMTGFAFEQGLAAEGQLTLTHSGSNQKYRMPVRWDKQGIAESIWTIPQDAKQGNYMVQVDQRYSGSFRVEAFRVPTMRAILKAPDKPLVNVQKATLDVQLNYLAGGGVGNAPVRLNSVLEPKSVWFADYDGFTFANGSVKEGVDQEMRGGLRIGDYLAGEPDQDIPSLQANAVKPLATLAFNLDRLGAGRATIDKLPKLDLPKDIVAELEYHDANGEISTASTRIALWPSNVVIGLKPDSWAASKDKLKFHAVAVDLTGKPLANVVVKVDLLQRKTYSHRKRLVGGFYAYENTSTVKRIGPGCEGKTDHKGLLICEVKSPVSGNIIVRGEAKDQAGQPSFANIDVWVAGKDDWWFEQSNDDRVDVLPEKKRYEPNETATFQVRMPFRQATALVTVEREGILKAFIVELSGKAPVVTVPLSGDYAPNVFVSVLAVRGRVGDMQPTALVDLGKPAFKLGIGEVKVGWRAHELKVNVETDKQLYRVRDLSQVKVRVRTADGRPLPSDAEFALAAVDEGLLELMPNASWRLLETMMRERGLGVDTATAQMQVVGRRHYGRKALAQGGGGGAGAGQATPRELFDTLLFWKARVKLDAKGKATLKVPLNDSLTSFRIVAVANAATGLFGTGDTSIRSTQDLMLFSGLPPVVREEDQFRGGFTLRNASDRKLEVELEAKITAGRAGRLATPLDFAARSLSLAPGAAQDVGWLIATPINAETLHWDIRARAGGADKPVSDRLKVTQKVTPAVRVRAFQATITQLEKPLEMQIALPVDAIPGRGGVKLDLSRSLAGQLDGVRDYMRLYVYTCLEQRVSKAIALRDGKLWQRVMDDLPMYLDRDGLAKFFPSMRQGSDTLTAYLVAIADEAGWEIPAELEGRMRAGLVAFVQGRIVRYSALPTADLAIRKIAAVEALSREPQIIDARLLDSFSIEPNLWPTSAVLDWYNILRRSPLLPNRAQRVNEAQQIIRSRLNFQGTVMGFSTERSDALWWLMISGDVNANRAVLSFLDAPEWREDMPRLVRGAVLRQKKGHWNTTVANAWGVLAVEKFAKAFESVPIVGVTSATLAAGEKRFYWKTHAEDGALELGWPKAQEKLSVRHQGSGKPWVTLTSLAAIPLKQALSTGFKVQRTLSAIEQHEAGKFTRGDVLRVRLDIEAQSDMTWVVVSDPIPAGAAILGTGLGRDSQILQQGERRQGWVWPAFEERSFDSFRAYYEYVPKGKWVVEYTMRLNNAGDFNLPETRVEALYAPEMFAEIPNAGVHVQQPEDASFTTRAKRWLDSLFEKGDE